jgi:signal transduction histidine kinase
VRAKHGFTAAQTVSEFRALRATILRLWAGRTREVAASDLEDMTRFNEAVDQALMESISRYSRDITRAKDRFLAILGHDLRTPLSSIVMSASFLLETGELGEPILKHIATIARSAKRIDQMVDDVLDFARAEFEGAIPIVRAEMDVARMVDDVASEIAASYPNSDVRVECIGELHGRWDSNRLAQALTNLIANALQHGSHESPVKVTAQGMENEVVISVQNRGPVIAADNLSRMFTAMATGQTNGGSRHGHLGLGLYIVNSIVLAHHGTVNISSSAEKGTTVTIHLPRSGE